MKIRTTYSHLNGLEWLQVHEPKVWKEIVAITRSVDATSHKTKISREKGMRGKSLFAAIEINKHFSEEF